MPIYLGLYHPKFNPFGEALDITPSDLETEFSSYKFNVQGRYRMWAYQGRTPSTHPIAQPNLSFWHSEDGGWSWERNDADFPSEMETTRGYIESTYMNKKLYYVLPHENVGVFDRLDVYSTEDFGVNWSLEWQLSEAGFNFGGNPSGYRLFPCASGVYVVAQMGKTGDAKIVVWKDGAKEEEIDIPVAANVGGLISSIYDNYYEVGYFDINQTPGFGGQYIYRFNNGVIEEINKTPDDPSGESPLFFNMWYITRKDFLMISTQALAGARIWYSFDGGKTLEYQLGAGQIKAYNFVTLGRQKLVVDLSTGDTFRSDAYLDDLNPGYTWDDVLDGINAPDFDYAFPLRLTRRGSEVVMWKLP